MATHIPRASVAINPLGFIKEGSLTAPVDGQAEKKVLKGTTDANGIIHLSPRRASTSLKEKIFGRAARRQEQNKAAFDALQAIVANVKREKIHANGSTVYSTNASAKKAVDALALLLKQKGGKAVHFADQPADKGSVSYKAITVGEVATHLKAIYEAQASFISNAQNAIKSDTEKNVQDSLDVLLTADDGVPLTADGVTSAFVKMIYADYPAIATPGEPDNTFAMHAKTYNKEIGKFQDNPALSPTGDNDTMHQTLAGLASKMPDLTKIASDSDQEFNKLMGAVMPKVKLLAGKLDSTGGLVAGAMQFITRADMLTKQIRALEAKSRDLKNVYDKEAQSKAADHLKHLTAEFTNLFPGQMKSLRAMGKVLSSKAFQDQVPPEHLAMVKSLGESCNALVNHALAPNSPYMHLYHFSLEVQNDPQTALADLQKSLGQPGTGASS